jgi:predicted Zn-dependent protease
MEEILQYVSLITICGAAISFVVGFIKWMDQRNREQEQKQFEAFHKMICLASGIDESGKSIKMVQQIAAIYQLQSYKRFAFASIPVLELLKFEFKKAHDDRDTFMEKALQETIHALSSR